MKMAVVATLLSGAFLVLVSPSLGSREASDATHPTAAFATGPSPLKAPLHAPALAPEDLTRVVQRYCVVCHNDPMMTGNLTLQTFDVAAAPERAEVAEKMIVKLRAGMMPPPGALRPGGDTLQMLVETLENEIDRAAREDPNPGARRFQRMNQAEYQRVIRDLLGLEINAGNWLPPDTYLGNFDNVAAAQGLSATLVEAYMRAAAEISRLAVGTATPAVASTIHRPLYAASQHAWDHVEGAPYGTRGGMVVTRDFPADGQYVFSIVTQFGNGTRFEDVDISVADEPVALLALGHNGNNAPIATEPIFVRAGQHKVAVSFVTRMDGPYEDRLSPHALSSVMGRGVDYGLTVLPHLREFTIVGPEHPTGLSETESRKRIFTCQPTAPSEQRACAESILLRVATRAYRRPVASEEFARLSALYETGSAEGGFEEGVRMALQAILASPFFVFRFELGPEGVTPGENYRLSDLDVASRLAFFLWGTVPDDELLGVAEEGGLSDVRVLERQARRMLADPRSEALATRFAAQWLRLQDLGKVLPVPHFYPDFTRQLANSMRRETELLFEHLVREDRSFLELFTADYTFVDQYLAQHYGIPFGGGADFQRVQYPTADRRGLLGHGSVLMLTSLANRTSPVLRGKWVMEVLLGTPPPPPPPGVPDLEQTVGAKDGKPLTTRERMELHRASPVCNACHQYMDPIGLALDNFDVTGGLRSRENGRPLDTRGNFYDGTPLATPAELRDVLLKRPIPLVRTFTLNLLEYATGRRAEYFDGPAVRAIAREAEENDYRMSSFVLGVVKSDAFRMKRAEPMADAGGR